MHPEDGSKRASPLRQWLWFLALWVAGVAVVGCVSLALRWILLP